MGNKNSSDVRQKNKTPLPLEKRPEVERLQELFPTWNRAAVEDVLTKCNGDEQKAVDAMFRMSVQLYSSPASVQKRKTRKEEEKKRRRLKSKKTKEEKTKENITERPSGPIPRPTTAEMWDDPKNQHCWYNVPGKTFDVRVGPNYRKNKTKAPSMSTWYDTVALELFTSNSSPGWMHDHIKMPALSWTMAPLPEPQTRKNGGGGSSDAPAPPKRPLPTHVIWNMQYPIYSPTMFKTQNDGEGINVYCIAELKESTYLESLLPEDEQSNALRLLRRWMYDVGTGDDGEEAEAAEAESSTRSTTKTNASKYLKGAAPWTKCIVRSINLEAPRLIRGYNGCPALHRTTTFRKWQGPNTLELQHTMHGCLPYVIKRLLYAYSESFAEWVFECGILVEGEGDEEQPERMLLSFGMCKCDANRVVKRFEEPRHMFVEE